MLEQSVTLEPEPGNYPLHITAKRYWQPEFDTHLNDPDAFTLIFLHATSFHKETWEPTIEQLFRLILSRSHTVKIREAWVVDCPNHGEAAQLNEKALQQPEFLYNFTCEKYARGVHQFLLAGPHRGARVDFRRRKILGIGHSLGGVAITILSQLQPSIPFTSLILIEPMLSPSGPQYFYELRRTLIKKAYERRDTWPDRETALSALKTRNRTARWHPRILNLYVKYALHPHPGSYYPEAPYNGVTLACTRDQEAAMYRDEHGPTKPVADLNLACAQIPVHIVLGKINDIVSLKVHDALIDPKSPRRYASITKLEKVGHLVPQQVPERLGTVLYNIITGNPSPSLRSKL